jgi:hypothetical protein
MHLPKNRRITSNDESVFVYNLCKVHRPLKTTPAVVAGWTNGSRLGILNTAEDRDDTLLAGR